VGCTLCHASAQRHTQTQCSTHHLHVRTEGPSRPFEGSPDTRAQYPGRR
jgi:hypothetical protein